MKNHNIKNDTLTENDFQKVFNYPIYPRGSKFFSDKKFAEN